MLEYNMWQGDLGDDRGGQPGKDKSDETNASPGNPGTVTAGDKDDGDQSTTEKVGSAQRSRQPGTLGQPSPTAR